jgi:hypothetical protein
LFVHCTEDIYKFVSPRIHICTCRDGTAEELENHYLYSLELEQWRHLTYYESVPRLYMVNISTNRDEIQISKSIFDIKSRASVPSVGITEESMEDSPPGIGLCGWILTGLSLGLVLLTVPFSLFVCFKVQYKDYSTDG